MFQVIKIFIVGFLSMFACNAFASLPRAVTGALYDGLIDAGIVVGAALTIVVAEVVFKYMRRALSK